MSLKIYQKNLSVTAGGILWILEADMNLMTMKYKDFLWPVNPVKLEVKQQKAVKETTIPFLGVNSKSICMVGKKISGKGYFTGKNAWETYLNLKAVFEKEGAGSLHLPGYLPFNAIMDSLVFIGEPGENIIEYSFSFIEQNIAKLGKTRCDEFALEDESLWDYAFKSNVSIDEMVKANPHIRDISKLKKGERVIYP